MIVVAAARETVSTVAGVGAVYVFNKPAGGWANDNSPDATLKPGQMSAPGNGGSGLGAVNFGNGLSVSDDGATIAVGAPHWERVDTVDRDPARINRDGAVFVFTKPTNGWADVTTDAATGVARLYAGSRVQRYAALGNTVAVSGDGGTIAAAAPYGQGGEGYVYMFTKGDGWADTGTSDEPKRLSATGRFTQQRLGSKGIDISRDGSTVVAGAPVGWFKGTSDDAQITSADAKGAAYVFAKPAEGWADATQTAKLATFGHKYDEFGAGVAISASGDRIAVSNSDSRSSNYRGSVYVYDKPAGGWEDDTDGAGDNVRVLTAADADTNARHRYGFGGRGLAFNGEDSLAVGQIAMIWALHKKDALSSLPTGGLYGANADHSNRANVTQGSAYLYKLRTSATSTIPYTPPPPPPPPFQPAPPPPPPPPGPDDGRPTGPTGPPPEFEDVDDESVHAENIEAIRSLGITRGTSPTTFSPSRPTARAQMATLLARLWEAAGRTCPTAAVLEFGDVAGGHSAGINCMAALGIVRGTASGAFSPWQPVTRAQMASLLVRFHQSLTE